MFWQGVLTGVQTQSRRNEGGSLRLAAWPWTEVPSHKDLVPHPVAGERMARARVNAPGPLTDNGGGPEIVPGMANFF